MSETKTIILLNDNCVLFEVTKTAMEMARGSEVLTASLDHPTPLKTMDGFILTPHIRLDDIQVDEIGCLVITGGPPETLYKHQRWNVLKQVIIRLEEEGSCLRYMWRRLSNSRLWVLDGKSFAGDLRDYRAYPELL